MKENTIYVEKMTNGWWQASCILDDLKMGLAVSPIEGEEKAKEIAIAGVKNTYKHLKIFGEKFKPFYMNDDPLLSQSLHNKFIESVGGWKEYHIILFNHPELNLPIEYK